MKDIWVVPVIASILILGTLGLAQETASATFSVDFTLTCGPDPNFVQIILKGVPFSITKDGNSIGTLDEILICTSDEQNQGVVQGTVQLDELGANGFFCGPGSAAIFFTDGNGAEITVPCNQQFEIPPDNDPWGMDFDLGASPPEDIAVHGTTITDPYATLLFDLPPATPQGLLEEKIDQLNSIVTDNAGTPLADKVQDALASAQTALVELNKTPPDNQAAAGNIEGAVGSLEDAIKDEGLDQTQGEDLINQLLDVSRQVAFNAIDTANTTPGSDVGKISSANAALTNGDTLRTPPTSFGDFKDAAAQYKVAIAEAEGALP